MPSGIPTARFPLFVTIELYFSVILIRSLRLSRVFMVQTLRDSSLRSKVSEARRAAGRIPINRLVFPCHCVNIRRKAKILAEGLPIAGNGNRSTQCSRRSQRVYILRNYIITVIEIIFFNRILLLPTIYKEPPKKAAFTKIIYMECRRRLLLLSMRFL